MAIRVPTKTATGAPGIARGVGIDLERLLDTLEDAGLPLGLTLFVVPKVGTLGDLLHGEGFVKRGINAGTLMRFRHESLDYDWSDITFETNRIS